MTHAEDMAKRRVTKRPVSRYVADRMRQRRAELRMTKADLAEAADLPVSVVIDIERKPGGTHAPRTVTVDDLVAMAKGLRTTPGWLLGRYGIHQEEDGAR